MNASQLLTSAEAAAMLERMAAMDARIEMLEKMAGGFEDATEKRLLAIYPSSMTTADAARELGVHRQTVYNMIADGRLYANPVGRIPTREFIEYIRGNRGKGDPLDTEDDGRAAGHGRRK